MPINFRISSTYIQRGAGLIVPYPIVTGIFHCTFHINIEQV